ncbi:MAG: penicillin-binding protein 1B [Gammaproteobacteria bacterium]|nr:penicillin-binding protein 1B [Gammaproteobacteria bacterium]
MPPKKKASAPALWRRLPWKLFAKLAAALAVVLAIYLVYLDSQLQKQFEKGIHWDVPAKVYARPLELFAGVALREKDLVEELKFLGYRATAKPERPGEYARREGELWIWQRGFQFPEGKEGANLMRLAFNEHGIASITGPQGEPVSLARLEPLLIGRFYPAHNEDRVLVKLKEVPQGLVDSLLAIEDRDFYEHHGISPKGIARAFYANVVAGGLAQGGSTLTQQLVKNYLLSSERTLSRKFTEVWMALLLETHYSKDEILQAYMNEIYLGQEGDRAIHGFGLAAQFYYDKPLEELNLPELALLAGIVQGPSVYDPRRKPERAVERRNMVLRALFDEGKLSEPELNDALSTPLSVVAKPSLSLSKIPAFLDLIRRQLKEDYPPEVLSSEGLRIFTTLDPRVQRYAELAVATKLKQLEQNRKLKAGELEGAAIITSTTGGEVMALVSGRQANMAGFNRAVDIRRPIGSLVKPAVYLAALEMPQRYNLMTYLDDSPFQIMSGGKVWAPNNYDKIPRGAVPLRSALAHSLNLATAKLGLDLGIPKVVDTLQRLGVSREIPPYPSLFLGVLELSPLEVARMYLTFASGGFTTPVQSIRAVTDAEGKALKRFPLEVEQRFEPGPVYLLNTALQDVVSQGTATSLHKRLPELHAAGKTGTTDDYRDAWFAGFTGDLLGVVWVGRDDNKPTGLTGASGALPIWTDMMAEIHPQPLSLLAPPDVSLVPLDAEGNKSQGVACRQGAGEVPFIVGHGPTVSCL